VPYVIRFFQFWYDFVVGDDWSVAAGVLAALVVTFVLARHGVAAWWLLPACVIVVLFTSLRRSIRRSG